MREPARRRGDSRAMTVPATPDTLVEERPPDVDPLVWLIAIGSPEDGFASAGEITPIIPGTRVEFGRAPARDPSEPLSVPIEIPLGWVSSRHASVEVLSTPYGPRFDLRDLGSRNGTMVAGQRTSGIVRLEPGQVFEIGRSFWTFRHANARSLRDRPMTRLDPTGTCNPSLAAVHKRLHRLAPSPIPLLLRGETGSGKEHYARAVHRASGRPGPFVVAHLAAISEARLEARLFGTPGQPGLIEEARGGTLLLDEVGDLSLDAQTKLRTALSDPEGVGSSNVRPIAASIRDLSAMVEQGSFLPDLYSRLAGYVADVPPLRQRREDLGLLCRRFLAFDGRQDPRRMTTHAFRQVLARTWPFNVRQLIQTLSSAELIATGSIITSDAIAEVLEQDDGVPVDPHDLEQLRRSITRLLTSHVGDPTAVARELGQSPSMLQRWLERFDLNPKSFRAEAGAAVRGSASRSAGASFEATPPACEGERETSDQGDVSR